MWLGKDIRLRKMYSHNFLDEDRQRNSLCSKNLLMEKNTHLELVEKPAAHSEHTTDITSNIFKAVVLISTPISSLHWRLRDSLFVDLLPQRRLTYEAPLGEQTHASEALLHGSCVLPAIVVLYHSL